MNDRLAATFTDDDLSIFEEDGPPPLPQTDLSGHVENSGASIWFASFGTGPAVILLHGGFGNAGNFGYQVPALLGAGYQAIVIDSRGHGRSSRDNRPFTYHLMASDVLAVMDHLGIAKAAIAGWSDGACTGLILGDLHPHRVAGVLFFACNMDPSGTLPFVPSPVIDRCFARHVKDYAELSPAPDGFDALVRDVQLMQQSEPNYSATDLARIHVPVTIALAAFDEFILPEHAGYLAATIPGARLETLPEVSHFAPVQRPGLFNAMVIDFLGQCDWG